jgi:hypothetical protein
MIDDQPSIIEPNWNDTDAPAEGQIVLVRAQDQRGFYTIPFPVEFRDDGWFNATNGEELDCFVAGWKPFDGPR